MNDIRVKICGLTSPEAAAHAAAAGAAYIGLMFYPPSPRALSVAAAREIADAVPAGVAKVAVVVDPDDALIDEIAELPIDLVQLHGAETPERVTEIRARTGLAVIKTIGIRDEGDLGAIARYVPVADQILVDAKPPRNAVLPGGNGLSFDWRLVAGRRWSVPWMLAGGLTAGSVREAIRLTGARQVDVSSGVESAPGIKDPAKVAAFIAAACG